MKTVLAFVLLMFAGTAGAQTMSPLLNTYIKARIQQRAADDQAAIDAQRAAAETPAQPATPAASPEHDDPYKMGCMASGRSVAECDAAAAPAQQAAAPQPHNPKRYSKVGATQEQFMSDRYACVKEAVQSRSVFIACMGARGYGINPTGNLAAPPGMTIRFSQP